MIKSFVYCEAISSYSFTVALTSLLVESMISAPIKSRMMTVFKYCEHAFRNEGIKLAFPQGTDPERTYKWRYLCKFVVKVDELKLSDDTIRDLIGAMVKHAKAHKQLSRGLAILTSDNMLEIGNKAITQKIEVLDTIFDRLTRDRKLIAAMDNPQSFLSKVPNVGGFANLSMLFMSGKLSLSYVACSKTCNLVIRTLDSINKDVLPSHIQLASERIKLFSATKTKYKIMGIMNGDWLDVG